MVEYGFAENVDFAALDKNVHDDKMFGGVRKITDHFENLRLVKANRQNDELPSNANKLYLWTEKGALLHAKSLGTDEAWDAYELLDYEYYKTTKEQYPITLALEASLE